MEQSLSSYVLLIPFATSVAVSLFVAFFAFRHRRVRGSFAFTFIAFSQSICSLGYLFELNAVSLADKVYWDYFQYFPMMVWPMALLVFSIQYSAIQLKSPRVIAAVVTIGCLPHILYILANPWHGEIYRDAVLVPGPVFDELHYSYTWVLYSTFAWFFTLCLSALTILWIRMPKDPSLHCAQFRTVFVGHLISVAGLLWGIMDIRIGPLFRDISPFTFAVSNLVIGWGMYRHHLLDVVPVARDRVLGVISDLVIVTDPRHRIVDINQATLRLLPPDHPDPFGRPFEEVFAFWPSLRDAINAIETPGTGSSTAHSADGKAFHFVREAIEEKGYVFVGHNITANLKVENLLRHSNVEISERLREIINALPFILVGVNRDLHVTHWNRQAASESGIPIEDAIGKPLNELWKQFPGDIDRLQKCIENATQDTWRDRYLPNESRRYFSVTTLPVQGGGVLIREDITTECQVQDTLVQTEKMISVGGLAAGMAHELNNPLAGILQTLQVIEHRLGLTTGKSRIAADSENIQPAQLQSFLQKIEVPRLLNGTADAGRRMTQIITNMLNFSQKRIDLTEDVDIARLLDDTVEIASADYDLSRLFDFKKIAIHREYEDNLPLISCNRSKIQQVFFNLLKNGAEAMMETGDVRPPTFILRLRADADQLVIQVQDNGPGMSAETQARVFEPFFSTKQTGMGTGLGMSVAYYIVTESHGGTLAVQSVPGGGCLFQIRLPARQETPAQ